ncbi:diguanylate cyclase [Catellatospora sp. NPDC049609]|uniref:bifunctional diguanylate cyclase/phosphohydrolase n=1 Tax=Catellatospora sp. NPDC049609 TaxID=3155505 RepID=UPI00341C7869
MDRAQATVIVVGVAWLSLYATLLSYSRDMPELARFVGEVLYLVPIIACVCLGVRAATRTSGRVRVAWRLLVVSNALWLLGEVIWAVYSYTSPAGPPVPSAADAAYLASYAVALPAIVVGLGLGVVGRGQGLLDALLVAAGAGAIGWQMIIAPLVPHDWTAAALVTFLYPVFSVSVVSILVAVMLSGSQYVPRSMIIVGAAFGLAAITDGTYAYLTAVREYESWSWVNLGWQIEAVLLCLAAVTAARRREGDEAGVPDPDLTFLPAVVAVLAVGGLALADLLLVGRLSEVTLAVIMLLLLGLLVRQVVATRDRTRLTQRLRTAAITDPLTGLHNRRFFEEMLDLEADRAVRRSAPLSLVLIDLDHFKEINDTYGHSTGDAVLTEVAQRLRRSFRAGDLLCRYGGEEFLCLLPGTGGRDALDLAERVRQGLCGTPVSVLGSEDRISLTASLGVATAEPGSGRADIDRLINDADQAVYRAKALGRDRVVGSGRYAAPELDNALPLPPPLVWLADRVDRAVGEREHSAAVARWALRTAARLGLDDAAQRRTAAAARVHDIGRIATVARPGGPGPHDGDRGHPEEGARLLAELADLPELAPLVAAHHEWYDGSGFPRGSAGGDIPIEARIIAVCDAWARLRNAALAVGEPAVAGSREELLAGRGSRFDPAVVDAFLELVAEGVVDEPAPLPLGRPVVSGRRTP